MYVEHYEESFMKKKRSFTPTLLAFFEKSPLLLSLCDRDCIEWQATSGKRKSNHLKAEQMTAGKKKDLKK